MPSDQQFELPLTATKCSRRRTDQSAQQSESRVVLPDSSRGTDRGASAYAKLPTLYLPEEVAAHLRVSIRTVKRFIASGRLKVTRFGRAPRIAEEDLENFMREGTCGIKATVLQPAYQEAQVWTAMSILNTARSGSFSSDSTIREYAQSIWHVPSVPIKLLSQRDLSFRIKRAG